MYYVDIHDFDNDADDGDAYPVALPFHMTLHKKNTNIIQN